MAGRDAADNGGGGSAVDVGKILEFENETRDLWEVVGDVEGTKDLGEGGFDLGEILVTVTPP